MQPEIYLYQENIVLNVKKCKDLELLYLINGLLVGGGDYD